MSTLQARDAALLICAYRLIGDGSAIDIGPSLNKPASGEFDWFHLRWDADGAEAWLHDKNIDKNVIDALLATDTRPRTIKLGNGLLIVLRGVNMHSAASPDDMVSIRVWISEGIVISTRKSSRNLLSVDDIRSDIANHVGPATPSAFLVSLAERLADRIGSVVDGIDDQLTKFETGSDDMAPRELRPQLADTRRQTASLRRYLAPQREAVSRLFSEKVEWLSDMDRLRLRESADRTTRFVEDLDMVRERAVVVQEELLGRLSEKMDRTMYVLSIVAAIFLPLGFLTGLLGINVGGIPGAEYTGSFVIFCLILVILVIFQIWLFKYKKWM